MGNKVYYDCPGCGNEVWAYSGFAGTRCWDCPGTIISGITNATPVISHVKTACEAIADVKTKYKCPRCGDPVWAYGQFAGQPCLKCKKKNHWELHLILLPEESAHLLLLLLKLV